MYADYVSPWHHHMGLEYDFVKHMLPSIKAALKKAPAHDTLVGCGLGSIPWVIALGRRYRTPYVIVRKRGEAMSADKYSSVVGRFGPERTCLFIDDKVYRGRTEKWVKSQLADLRTHGGATYVGTLQLNDVKLLPSAKAEFPGAWKLEDAAQDYLESTGWPPPTAPTQLKPSWLSSAESSVRT